MVGLSLGDIGGPRMVLFVSFAEEWTHLSPPWQHDVDQRRRERAKDLQQLESEIIQDEVTDLK